MLSNFLIKKFIKNNDDINDNKVRIAYGKLGGAVGIIINTLLFLIKLFVGLFAGSIAIIADAFNNLSDAASSIITIIGFKMANKPADAEHPFGHGRIEYISALVVSFMVMLVGFQFVKTSFSKILNPEAVTFEIMPFLLLLISIGFKIWLSKFNKNDVLRTNKAFKKQKLDIKLKSGWKISSVHVTSGTGSYNNYRVNKSSFSKKITVSNNYGYIYVYCYNEKTKVSECLQINTSTRY